MELQVLNHVQEFNWNFQEIKQAVTEYIEKYHGLVVTEENLKDMEAAQKEVAAVRIKIDGFRKEVKKRLEEPYKQFDIEIKELQALVEKAEGPLKEQIYKYETDRIKKREEELMQFAKKTAAGLGVRDDYFKLAIPSKWTNRTARDSAIKKEIVSEIEAMLEQQRRDDEAIELLRQRAELIDQTCAEHSKLLSLKTPVTAEDVSHILAEAKLSEIPAIVIDFCCKRHELETRAAEADSSPSLPESPTDSCERESSTETQQPPLPPPPAQRVPMPPPVPPSSAIAPTLYFDCVIRYPKITIRQAAAIKQFIAAQGIQYEVVSQIQRSDA